MQTEETRKAVIALYAAYRRRDFAAVSAVIDDHIDWSIEGPIHVFPFVGYRRGRQAVMEVFAAIAKDYELESHTPEAILADGDRAAVLVHVAFRQRSSGRVLSFRVANFLRLRDGRVIEFREVGNTLDQVEQALGREFDV